MAREDRIVEAIAGKSVSENGTVKNLGALFKVADETGLPVSRSWYRQLPLAPLGPEAIRELLDDLLGSDPSIEGLGDAIHERTDGNPFFTEEVVQSLIESGHLEGTRGDYRLVTPIERLGVPASVHAVLAARIDRLAEREKHVLQSAGVIGKDFARPILEPVVELGVRDLDAALVHES